MWWQRALVALALAAPVLVVLVVAWPEGSGGDAVPEVTLDGVGDVDLGDLNEDDEVDVDVPAQGAARFTLVGTGARITVRAEGRAGFDSTLTVVDEEGNQIAYNDDSNGLDPEVVVDLDDDQQASVEVRSFGGQSGRVVVVRQDG
jgi:hypothetical protein